MIPQLFIVEMLLADASGKLTSGEIDRACQVISQAACMMDKVVESVLQPVVVPAIELVAAAAAAATVSEVVPLVELPPATDLVALAEAAQVSALVPAKVAAMAEAKPERPRAMAAAA